MTSLPNIEDDIKWNYYDYSYYDTKANKDYIKIEFQDKLRGYKIDLMLDSSSRGVNCYDSEIDTIIEKLICVKNKIEEIKGTL